MSDAMLLALARDALMTALWVGAPMLAAALVIGVVISILQVATSIQDQTLAAVPKLLGVLAALLISLHFILRTLVAYASRILLAIPDVVGR